PVSLRHTQSVIYPTRGRERIGGLGARHISSERDRETHIGSPRLSSVPTYSRSVSSIGLRSVFGDMALDTAQSNAESIVPEFMQTRPRQHLSHGTDRGISSSSLWDSYTDHSCAPQPSVSGSSLYSMCESDPGRRGVLRPRQERGGQVFQWCSSGDSTTSSLLHSVDRAYPVHIETERERLVDKDALLPPRPRASSLGSAQKALQGMTRLQTYHQCTTEGHPPCLSTRHNLSHRERERQRVYISTSADSLDAHSGHLALPSGSMPYAMGDSRGDNTDRSGYGMTPRSPLFYASIETDQAFADAVISESESSTGDSDTESEGLGESYSDAISDSDGEGERGREGDVPHISIPLPNNLCDLSASPFSLPRTFEVDSTASSLLASGLLTSGTFGTSGVSGLLTCGTFGASGSSGFSVPSYVGLEDSGVGPTLLSLPPSKSSSTETTHNVHRSPYAVQRTQSSVSGSLIEESDTDTLLDGGDAVSAPCESTGDNSHGSIHTESSTGWSGRVGRMVPVTHGDKARAHHSKIRSLFDSLLAMETGECSPGVISFVTPAEVMGMLR
ncbi:hypothetical protein KIPB_006897, partial [Kipferlia bialata]